MISAQCFCKKITVSSTSPPRYIFNCHCTICRERSGAPFTTWLVAKESDVTVKGSPKYYDTNPNVKRGFCPTCGTDLTWQNKTEGKWLGIVLGACKNQHTYTPNADIWVQSKLDWVYLDPKTSKHNKGPFEGNVFATPLPYVPEEPIHLEGKIFKPISNASTGQVSELTTFHYHQNNTTIWANYTGGLISKGFLLGSIDSQHILTFNYVHIDANDQLKTGFCTSYPCLTPDKKLQFEEHWQWTCDSYKTGTSTIEEI